MRRRRRRRHGHGRGGWRGRRCGCVFSGRSVAPGCLAGRPASQSGRANRDCSVIKLAGAGLQSVSLQALGAVLPLAGGLCWGSGGGRISAGSAAADHRPPLEARPEALAPPCLLPLCHAQEPCRLQAWQYPGPSVSWAGSFLGGATAARGWVRSCAKVYIYQSPAQHALLFFSSASPQSSGAVFWFLLLFLF